MKNFAKLIGIIAIVAVIGFSMGCKNDDDGDGDGGGGRDDGLKLEVSNSGSAFVVFTLDKSRPDINSSDLEITIDGTEVYISATTTMRNTDGTTTYSLGLWGKETNGGIEVTAGTQYAVKVVYTDPNGKDSFTLEKTVTCKNW